MPLDDKKQENGRDTNGMFRKHKERKRFIKCCRENFFWVSSFFTFLASCLGLFSLWVFAQFVGRPDVFVQSLEFGPGLLLLVPFFLFVYGILIACFIGSSWLFVFAVRNFKHGRESAIARSFWLLPLGMVACCASVIILVVMYWKEDGWPWCWFVLFGFVCVGLFFRFVRQYGGGVKEVVASSEMRVLKCLCLAFSMVVVAAVNTFFSIGYQKIFQEADVKFEGVGLFAVLLFLSVIPLVPVVLFYVREGKGEFSQVVGGAAGVLLFHAGLFVGVPWIFGVASTSAMMFLGVVDMEPKRYLVNEAQYPEKSLNNENERWLIERHGENHYSLEAVSIYAYGAINLLCPADFVKSQDQNSKPQSGAEQRKKWHADLDKLKSRIQDCIPFQRDEVRKLDTRPVMAENLASSGGREGIESASESSDSNN